MEDLFDNQTVMSGIGDDLRESLFPMDENSILDFQADPTEEEEVSQNQPFSSSSMTSCTSSSKIEKTFSTPSPMKEKEMENDEYEEEGEEEMSKKKQKQSELQHHDYQQQSQQSNYHQQLLQIQPQYMSKDRRIRSLLDNYFQTLTERTSFHCGYPYNLDFNFEPLLPFMQFSLNNLGDPFVESNYMIHSRQFELEVLEFFAKLYELEEDEYWGYVTSCGTEGNLHGLVVARENLPTGILYASVESHYSVFKAARFFRMKLVTIRTLPNGEIDYDELSRRLSENKDTPAIINLNMGTTLKGAIDNLDQILQVLYANGFDESRFHIHCDGALSGLMLPFIANDEEIPNNDCIKFTFKKPIASVSISGHKFLGCPFPCGVIIHRKKNIQKIATDIEYIGSKDTTITGSRNGLAPLFMWYTIRKKGRFGFKRDVEKCLANAQYLYSKLKEARIEPCMLNKWGNTVVFRKPKDLAFIKKWQIATAGELAHVITMPNITKAQIDNFVEEYLSLNDQ